MAISRALAPRPSIMLFGEVTSALDLELSHEVLLVMRELAANGMTMVAMMHELDFSRNVADRITFIHEGRIVNDDTPEAVPTKPAHGSFKMFLCHLGAADDLPRGQVPLVTPEAHKTPAANMLAPSAWWEATVTGPTCQHKSAQDPSFAR